MKIPTEVREVMKSAVVSLSRAKELNKEAKALSDNAKGILLPAMEVYGLEDFSVPKVGKVQKRINKGSSINSSKLKTELLLRGIDVDSVNEIIHASSNTWETAYVAFNNIGG